MEIDSSEQIFSIADIHKKNIASREMVKRIGYKEEIGKSDDFILVRKKLI